MTPAPIPAAILPRVAGLLRLLGSDVDGEALGAARALRRTLGGVGLDLHALAEIVERPIAPAVVFRDAPRPPRPRQPGKPRGPQPGDVVLDAAACRRVGEALYRALAGGRLSGWQMEFAGSLAEQMEGRSLRLTRKQGDALGRLLMKVGEAAAWV